jgi:deazaflavin-dependent oxidoreductase (nitroreductase family)
MLPAMPSYLDVADRSWPLLRRLMGLHTAIYRASGGRIGHNVPGAPPMLLLDHVGARSGTRRTSPLAYARDGEDIVIVASKGGNPKNPAWFHNLRANPDTTVQVGTERIDVHARVAEGSDRERLWPKVVEVYGGYEDYQKRTDRKIPLVVLEPRPGGAG